MTWMIARRKLLMRLLMAGITVVISGGAYYSYQAVRNLTLDSLKRNAFLETQRGADSIDSWLAGLKTHMTTLANAPVVRSLNLPAIEPFFTSEVLRFSDIATIALSGINGQTILPKTNQENLADRSYFQNALAGTVSVSDPSNHRHLNLTGITIAAPIRQELNATALPIGVIYSIVKVDRIAQVIDQLHYGAGSYAFALNSQGSAIVHPDPKLVASQQTIAPILLQADDEGLAQTAQQMVSKRQGLELQKIDGEWKYVAYVPLKEANWSVALVIPRDNIEAPLRSLDLLALVIALFALSLIGVLWQVQAAEQSSLRKSNEELEHRVTERTAELSTALEQLQQSQMQLIQSEKMSSLGQLVAGVAHEINNPVSFIYGNLNHASRYLNEMIALVQLYRQEYPEPTPCIQEQSEAMDLDFLIDDLPKMLSSMKMGADRIKDIVLSLRTFSRMDEAEVKAVNIHEGLDSTLVILEHRLKAHNNRPRIRVVKEYGNLPLVECYAGQMNQVFMNILSNAIDALEEALETRKEPYSPTLMIKTRATQHNIVIHVIDNGLGIPESVRRNLFNPFFTTKPVGKGTGMGLSISYQIVTERHGGSLTCLSQPDQGAEFIIQIPCKNWNLA